MSQAMGLLLSQIGFLEITSNVSIALTVEVNGEQFTVKSLLPLEALLNACSVQLCKKWAQSTVR